MEGFIPIFSLILTNLNFIVEQSNTDNSCNEENFPKKTSKLLDIHKLIDISSSKEDEEDMQERASTPVPRVPIPNSRRVLKASLSTAEAVVDEE